MTNCRKGCTPPWGESEGFRAKKERKSDVGGGVGWVVGGGLSKSCRNKLALSCRGMGGETEMDTIMLAKSRSRVEAHCLPWPFLQSSSLADYEPTSL